MTTVEIPYKPKGTPEIEFVEHNGANFKTVTWKVPQSVSYKGKIIYVHGFAEESNVYTEFLIICLKMVTKFSFSIKEVLVKLHQVI